MENLLLEEKTSIAKQNLLNYKSEFERLSKISVLNEVFEIQVHDDMPTIAKIHLGVNPQTGMINWDETSAGLSHVCLLLNYLVKKNEISLGDTHIVPMGTLSEIVITEVNGSRTRCLLSQPKDNVG